MPIQLTLLSRSGLPLFTHFLFLTLYCCLIYFKVATAMSSIIYSRKPYVDESVLSPHKDIADTIFVRQGNVFVEQARVQISAVARAAEARNASQFIYMNKSLSLCKESYHVAEPSQVRSSSIWLGLTYIISTVLPAISPRCHEDVGLCEGRNWYVVCLDSRQVLNT